MTACCMVPEPATHTGIYVMVMIDNVDSAGARHVVMPV